MVNGYGEGLKEAYEKGRRGWRKEGRRDGETER